MAPSAGLPHLEFVMEGPKSCPKSKGLVSGSGVCCLTELENHIFVAFRPVAAMASVFRRGARTFATSAMRLADPSPHLLAVSKAQGVSNGLTEGKEVVPQLQLLHGTLTYTLSQPSATRP
jgi:hypothetical protein